jgi:hypothetical protein
MEGVSAKLEPLCAYVADGTQRNLAQRCWLCNRLDACWNLELILLGRKGGKERSA